MSPMYYKKKNNSQDSSGRTSVYVDKDGTMHWDGDPVYGDEYSERAWLGYPGTASVSRAAQWQHRDLGSRPRRDPSCHLAKVGPRLVAADAHSDTLGPKCQRCPNRFKKGSGKRCSANNRGDSQSSFVRVWGPFLAFSGPIHRCRFGGKIPYVERFSGLWKFFPETCF